VAENLGQPHQIAGVRFEISVGERVP
jgi:hypothetical protein